MIIAVSTSLSENVEKFIYCKVERNIIREQESAFTPPGGKTALIKQFIGLEIDLLIIGKISGELEADLREAGIAVLSHINGVPEQILKQYLDGTLNF
jgi:predicted Fe-Mo cluster-binding NifX family protein